jgi:hypothetical protein
LTNHRLLALATLRADFAGHLQRHSALREAPYHGGELRQCEPREGLRDHAREDLNGFGAGFGVELHARRCRWSGKIEKRQSQLHGSFLCGRRVGPRARDAAEESV